VNAADVEHGTSSLTAQTIDALSAFARL